LRIQILPTLDDLPKARKNQFAAFIADETLLVVWDDEPTTIVSRVQTIEDELMELIWKTGELSERKEASAGVQVGFDEENGETKAENRPTHIMNSVLVAFTLLLITIMLGAGFRQIVIEITVDRDYKRLAFLALAPV
jgi:hypothetical protein